MAIISRGKFADILKYVFKKMTNTKAQFIWPLNFDIQIQVLNSNPNNLRLRPKIAFNLP